MSENTKNNRQFEESVNAFKPLADAAWKSLRESAISISMDGNQFCAVRPDFINLQESPAGFGDTQKEAAENLLKELKTISARNFDTAKLAERRLENLQYDSRPYKPASYSQDVADARKAYSTADADADKSMDAVAAIAALVAGWPA